MDGDLLRQPFVVRRKIDVDEYHRMGEAGILTADDRVELIEGELIEMAPIGSRHSGTSIDLNQRLVLAVRGRALVGVGAPIRLDRHNEPEPDFSLLRLRADNYREAHAKPSDVLLLIELAETSLRFDRRVKLPLYGQHGIAEYWIFDLAGRRVEVCRGPNPDGYASVVAHGPEAIVAPEAFPDLALRVADLLG